MRAEIKFRVLERKDLGLVVALHGELYPRRKSVSALEWEFFSPSLPERGVIIGGFDGDHLVATRAFIPVIIRYKGNEALSVKGELTLIRPEYRGKGIFDNMYEYGIKVCEDVGATCIWGFTVGTKPQSRLGYEIIGPLYEEYLILDPFRLLLAKVGYKANPKEMNIEEPIISEETRFGEDVLHVPIAHERIKYRYLENPWRRVAQIDRDNGCLYSYDPEKPHFIFLSEVADPLRVIESIKTQSRKVGLNWVCIHRFCNVPMLGWFKGLKGIPLRRESRMKMVFKWLGDFKDEPLPKFWIEEGYKEGT
jgi:GNAT superfamily N-acetyltransferase